MKRDELRLELLKLVYTHGRDAAEAVGRARILEKFILEEDSGATRVDEVKKPDPRKK